VLEIALQHMPQPGQQTDDMISKEDATTDENGEDIIRPH
jgi:hypothetical protein